MKLETVPLGSISFDPANTRKHSRRNLDAIKASLRRFGQQKPIVVDAKGIVLAGNGTLAAATELGWSEIQIVRTALAGVDATAFGIADNRTAELAEWDDKLGDVLAALKAEDFPLAEIGFDEADLAELAGEPEPSDADAEPQIDKAEELRAKWGVELGQLWELGDHRLMCGDSTNAADVTRLMRGEKAALVHADPPYGMGKEKEGVANDNLYADKLDDFQMAWWRAMRPHVTDNGSAYIWGNAEDLWRLWYRGGLKDSERLTFRNEIVWDKGGGGFGVGTEAQRCYFPEERCLFFMLGEQGFNNNADNYWDGWEGIRSALEADCKKMGWGAEDIKRICGVGMYGHWFTRSQWTFIPEEHYRKLQAAAREHDAFKREHDAFKREHDELKREHDELKREFYSTRSYFDNTHDNMTDVWSFARVTGKERHGHATPKPVEMMKRVMLSSLPKAGICFEPFGGSGSTLMGAQNTGRKCRAIELNPAYVAVAIQRWADATGKEPRKL